MSKAYLYHLYHLLLIIPVYTFSGINLENIMSFESISCKSDIDCPDNLSCKNNFCQYPIYYCLGNYTCIEENISNNIYYSHKLNIQNNEGYINDGYSYSEKKNMLIVEACHPTHKDCQTRSCTQDLDCFTGICDKNTKKCLINEKFPLYACINNKYKGGMICGKYLEEECIKNDDCLTNNCDTHLNICNTIDENDNNRYLYNSNMGYNATDNSTILEEENTNSETQKNATVSNFTLVKEGCILAFVILPVIVFTQYLKSTKTVKNIKNNRKSFEYKTVLVDDLSNC